MPLEMIGLAVSVAVPLIGAVLAVGKLVQMIRDHERRILRLEDEAEEAEREVNALRLEAARNK